MLNRTIFLFSLSFFLISSSIFSKILNESEMHLLAKNYFYQNLIPKEERLVITNDKLLFKKSILFRGKVLNKINAPFVLVLVSSNGELQRLNLEQSFESLVVQLSSFIKYEDIFLKKTDEVILFLNKLLNIYGVYSGHVNCKTLLVNRSFNCHLSSAIPKKLDLSLIVGKTGEIEFK